MGNRNGKNNRPSLPKVQRIEVSEKHIRVRVVLFALLLVVGIGALLYGLIHYLTTGNGWREITVQTKEENLAGEVFFYYDIGGKGAAAGTEYRQVRAVYTEASVASYRIFHATEEFAGVYNLAYLNRRVNEPVTLNASLYRALEQIAAAGDRTVFCAPYYDYYQNLFFCTDVIQIRDFDPLLNETVADRFAGIAAYVNDPNAVWIELLGENRACLHVSEEYLAFARENGISAFVNLGWLRNAFTLDYIADVLTQNGYTNGVLSSFDGFIRNLDARGTSFSVNLYNREQGAIYAGGVLVYDRPMSIVILRDYPLNDLDDMNYFTVSATEIRHPYINGEGYCQASIPQLAAISETAGCAEIALRLAPLYIAPEFNAAAFRALAGENIGGVYCAERVFYTTAQAVAITDLYSKDDVHYSAEFVGG